MKPPKATEANSMPTMGAAFSGWTVPVALVRLSQQIIDGIVTNTREYIRMIGVVQPLEARRLALKPEGQRSFTWLQMHIVGGYSPLKPNDRVEYKGKEYKVIALYDYSQSNYTEYELVQDFKGNPSE